MPHARLDVEIPAGTWIHEVSTEHPTIAFTVVTAIAGDDSAIGQLEIGATDPVPVLASLNERSDVVTVDLLYTDETVALVQLETSNPFMLVPAWRAGVPLRLPFEIRDGVATWELTTSSDRLAALGDQLDGLDISYTIDHVREIGSTRADQLLTDRQQEVLTTAIQRGYYETPREMTLTELADVLGVAKASCSDVLHRAERNVLEWFADEHMTAGD